MRIVDAEGPWLEPYLTCLEPWDRDGQEGRARKAAWRDRMIHKGLIAKIAVDDDGVAAGMIHALPIEHTFAVGSGLYVILCIWVHRHEQGAGNRQGKGIGDALLTAMEEEVRARGALGIAAWGLRIPVWMQAKYFRHRGYRTADNDGIRALVWKPFSRDAQRPKWAKGVAPTVPPRDGKLHITCCDSGWCNAVNSTVDRAHRLCAQHADQILWDEVLLHDPEVPERHGDAVFFGRSELRLAPPPSDATLARKLDKAVRHAWDQKRI